MCINELQGCWKLPTSGGQDQKKSGGGGGAGVGGSASLGGESPYSTISCLPKLCDLPWPMKDCCCHSDCGCNGGCCGCGCCGCGSHDYGDFG